ncbi:MAG TPA: hypothetical protein VH720_15265 [Candidatus Limnocylindrales bacterium]|jgi:hypothetical protein
MRRRSRVARTLAAFGAAMAILGATLPVVRAAPEDVVVLTAGTAQVNGAKDANYAQVAVFGQNGSGGDVARLYAVYNDAGCSGAGELFVFIKMTTPGLTVRTIDNPSGLSMGQDNNDDGDVADGGETLAFNSGPAYSVDRKGGEFSVCYTTVDAPAGEGIGVTFLFSLSPATGEGRVARLLGATGVGDVGIHIASPESGVPPLPSGTLESPASPVRILDTRIDKGLANKFAVHEARSLQVTGANGIPADAVAITGNLTVVKAGAGGFLSVLASQPVGQPTSSTLNFVSGETLGNNVVAPLAADGTLWISNWSGSANHIILDVTGWFVTGTGGADYVDVTPARILDSRNGIGLSGFFTSGTARSFTVRGVGGVPNDPDVVAVTGNLTVVQQNAAGNAALTTSPTNSPATSTVNFTAGGSRANGIVIALANDGTLSAVVNNGPGKRAHLIFDVTGYFTNGAGGAIYHQIDQVTRVMDTRSGNGLSGDFINGTARTLTISPRPPHVPAGATGVTGNLTVTGQSASGFVSMTKLPDDTPTTSTLNFPVGMTRANGVVAPLDSGQASFTYVSATGGAHTDLLFDVTGYFAP